MKQKYPNDLVKKIVEEDTDHEYSLLSIESQGKKNPLTGKTMKRRMSLQHNNTDCGHTYEVDIYEFIEGKRRCGKCKGKVLREHFVESIESIKQRTVSLTDSEYRFIDDKYTDSKTLHRYQHTTCGTKFEKKWDKFKGTPKQPGQRCPECTKKGMESVASRYARDVLDHLHIEYVCEKRFDDCRNPKTGCILPFDYYLPEINTIIEIDGEQHERCSFSKYDYEGTMKRDKIKNQYAEKKGIELVRIPAKKWSELPEFLYAILSKKLIPTLTLETVKEITHSTHPERVNKDLEKVHNGEYQLHDNYYFGVDREHNFIHTTCDTVYSFIENINVASEDYNRKKGLLNKYAFINRHNAIAITKDQDNNEIHHHRFYDRGFKKYCEYYIIFSPSDQEILGWGFENNETSKYCEIRS